VNRTVNARFAGLLLGAAFLAVPTVQAMEPSLTVLAAEDTSATDLSDLQKLLAAEQLRIEQLTRLAERAQAGQQQIAALQQENQQLRADIARLDEQVHVAEGRAAKVEAERDQLRAELAKLREQTAAAAEDARRSLVTIVTRIKDLNEVAGSATTTEPAAPAQVEQAPAPPVVAAPSQPAKRQVRATRGAPPAPAPKAPEQVETTPGVTTAALEDAHTDQRGVLGGRPAALSFANLPAEKRIQIRKLFADLHSGIDERGLVTILPADDLFASGSDRLRPGARDALGKVGQLIKATGDHQVLIVAHTDGVGEAAYDQRLSELQAAAVKTYLLVNDAALAPSRLTAQGMGTSRPVASDATEEGRGANRRVEILILN
jgi:outer membrane protein OmpA-like peptidoglycan-associated protein